MRDRLLASVIDAVRRSRVQRQPFVHAFLEQVWPADVYADLLAALPPASEYRDDNPAKYGRPDGRSCRQVLPLGDPTTLDPLWTAVRDVLMASELQAAVCAHVGVRAVRADGRPASSSRPVLVRDLPGYWIEPHPDSRAKQITMQFYLPADAAQSALGTTLYQLRPFRPSAWIGRAPFMHPVHRFPFVPNSGYIFPVRWNSFHGVERLAADSGVRQTLMNTYYWEI
jgi:hypothetical protein